LAIGPPIVRRQLGVGLMLGIAVMTRITVAYAAVLVPISTFFAGNRGNLSRRITAAGCGVLVMLAIIFAWRSLLLMAGVATQLLGPIVAGPFVGAGGIASRMDDVVDAADSSHFAWGDDRIPHYRNFVRPDARRVAAKQWTLERDREEFLDQEGIQ